VKPSDVLATKLRSVRTSKEFEDWVRYELRRTIPHAAFVGTFGRLYGVGSVATHRVSVDFPLNMVEQLKSSSGALDDPLLLGWFKNRKLRYIELQQEEGEKELAEWQKSFGEYGIQNMLIHGVMNARDRQFMTFQVCNLYEGCNLETARTFGELVQPMYEKVRSSIAAKSEVPLSRLLNHPTVSLTATEVRIIEFLAQGLSNKEIARCRGVSDSTIKTQIARTGAKLGANRRAEIVAIAMSLLASLPACDDLDMER